MNVEPPQMQRSLLLAATTSGTLTTPTRTVVPVGATINTASTPIPMPIPQIVRSEKPERNFWREQEMLTVIQIIRENNYLALLNDKTIRSETVFRNIEKEMHDRGMRKKNFQQIWTKWKFMKSTYMTSRRMHQIPRIISLDVYQSLDELLSAEFRNDGSVSSHDGGDNDDIGGVSNYDIMNPSASAGSNDGLLVISNVQGGVPYNNNSARNYTNYNGFAGMNGKFKNGYHSFKNEADVNGFGMQHPIFGCRLGVVKDEPLDDDYENSNNTDHTYPSVHLEESTTTHLFPEIKTELTSPTCSTTPPPVDPDIPPVPIIQMPPLERLSSSPTIITQNIVTAQLNDIPIPPLHRYTSPFQVNRQSEIQVHPPPLKQMPLVKITLPPKPSAPQANALNTEVSTIPSTSSPTIPEATKSKKIPVLTIRKRKKRLNIPQLSGGANSPSPSSKHSKQSDDDDPKDSRIPFVTYSKAMREMSVSLREIQREMIDEFFKQQMELARTEHEFQKQQDAMLLRCFEDQTKKLLEGAKKMFAATLGNNSDFVYLNNE